MRRDEVPEHLAHLPFDERRGLPVPFMNQHYPPGPFGATMRVDFTGIWADAVLRCGQDRLCGICGNAIGREVTFVGGPVSAETRVYQDPPFHEACALFATRTCPHMVTARHQRASEARVGRDSGMAPGEFGAPTGAVMDKAQRWVLGVAKTFEMGVLDGYLVFRAAPFVRTRTFGYVHGVLAEITG